ncbi:MAG: hypothetical protein HXY26_11635 [Hydrogenophilaceae bacterium]|nr:hypothetical protein [Hydrogenophilaceae bacterium]
MKGSEIAMNNEMQEREKMKEKSRITFIAVRIFLVLFLLLPYLQANAGKHAYPELIDHVAHETREILKKHGMPVKQNVENPWFRHSASPGNYTLIFYLSDEIPLEAKLDVIRLCMRLYQERGRKYLFRIVMYQEAQADRHRWFSGIEPSFELTIGKDK